MAPFRRLQQLNRHLCAVPVADDEQRQKPAAGVFKLTEEDDANADLIPEQRNNEARRAVGIGTGRTEFMQRVLGETGDPGQHDSHGGYEVEERVGVTEDKEVVICGAGFAGLAAVKSLREAGIDSNAVRVFERGAEVGGTWYWNRYPGAAVDIPSAYYSFSFTDTSKRPDDGWQFSHKYSYQPELFEYAKWVSHTFGLREQMRFQTAITRTEWKPETAVRSPATLTTT